ncbi:hypothetical protein ACQ4LE_008870 [Meloidogyne hapla]
MAYDDNLPYQQDNQNIENNFKENLPTKGKKKYKRSKKAPTIKKVQENLKINENEGGQKMNFVIYLTILMNKRSQSLQVNRLWETNRLVLLWLRLLVLHLTRKEDWFSMNLWEIKTKSW